MFLSSEISLDSLRSCSIIMNSVFEPLVLTTRLSLLSNGVSQIDRILKDEATEEKGERARMDKILQSTGRGHSVTVTNDGTTILKSLHIDNPAAKVLVDISKVQDDEVGDGTTSVVVLAGELLREAEKLRNLGPDLMNIAMTTLSSKILSQDKEHFAKLSVDAVMRLKGSTNLEAVQIIKKPGEISMEDNEESCEVSSSVPRKRAKRNTSIVWNTFTRLPRVSDSERSKAQCQVCKEIFVADSGTTNMKCHMSKHLDNGQNQAGLEKADEAIEKVREGVKHIKHSEGRILKFVECIKNHGLSCSKKLRQDASEEEWKRVEVIAKFLKPFYEITTLFSGSKYPTANLYLPNVWKIQMLLKEAENGSDLTMSEMVTLMLRKFKKYWRSYSMILSIAIVLDPRYKMKFVKFCFSKIDPVTADVKVEKVLDHLELLFKEYLISSTSISLSMEPTTSNEIGDVLEEFDVFENQSELGRNKTQLDLYLEEPKLDRKANPNLDVLAYWKENSARYPELSLMARDVLSTTVASESTFSIGGRIIGKFQSSILPTNAEARFILDKKIGVGQPKRIENAKILVANTAMDTDKVKIYGARVRVDSMAKVAELEAAEKDKMTEKVQKIISHGINCFVNRQLIYNFPEELFADAGILAIEHADFDGIERLALVTGGEIASTFDNPESVKLGHCKLIEEIMIGEDKLIHFSGVELGQACTIVLRSASLHVLDEAERSLHDALCVLSQTVNDSRVLLGGGWPEMVMAKAVDELAKKTPGKRSHAIEAFSRALFAIPTIIADNAGLDGAELVAQLRAEHHKDESNAGIDVITGKVGDMAELGISEAFKS
ncbi:T-complex protein 1 subunit beta [Capsicum chinense]|nr:T-complex protein 1 subunit beta [Capsicum chinense]